MQSNNSSYQEIGDEIGVHRETIGRWIRQYNNGDGCCAGNTMKNGDSSSGDNLLMGTLHFYDRVDMNIAAKSMDWALSMWGLNNELRGKVKYGEESEDYINGVQWARNQLHEQLEEHGVSLEDIV